VSAEQPPPKAAPPAAQTPKPAAKPGVAKLVSVEFLDGSDTAELKGTGQQFVNLPKDPKWVDNTNVKNLDRLSRRARVKVTFDQKGAHPFKLKLLPGPGNAAYSAGEKARNDNFKYQDQQKEYVTDGDGTKIIRQDFFVTAAGLDSYTVEGEDQHGNKQTSKPVQTQRLVWYQQLKMKNVKAASSLATFESEFAKHGIRLVSLGDKEMDHMPNISTGDSETFKTKARTAYTASSAARKEPYVVAIAYTDHLAVKDSGQVVVKSDVEVGPGKPAVEIPITKDGNAKYLWKDIVPGEGWFVSAGYLSNEAGAKEVAIPEAKCTAVPLRASAPSMCNKVKIDVTGLPAGKGTITLKVNWVNRMRGGLEFPGGNLICVCTRAWWQDASNDKQNQILIHEMGHKVGMVADGTGTGPDKVATWYNDAKGHVGPHCHNGLPADQARYDGSGDLAKSTCVMYGATNGKTAFCANCAPTVRKEDLGKGWRAF
jgi:hypothetical protein